MAVAGSWMVAMKLINRMMKRTIKNMKKRMIFKVDDDEEEEDEEDNDLEVA
jgi:hypothetical protein